MLERQVEYAVRQIRRMADEGLAWLDVRPEVMRDFNEQLQDDIRAVEVWQAACGNDFYYRAGPSGRLVTQWPKSMDDFTAATTADDRDAFEAHTLA